MRPPPLKDELQGELHHARVACGEAAGSADVALDPAKVGVLIEGGYACAVGTDTRIGWIQMIGKVECFGS